MNCDECKNLISVFMDDELDEARASGVRTHLAVCDDCARVCEDLASILDVCTTETPSEILPPNSKALWCRINNIIESEKKPEPPPTEQPKGRLWRFSFIQVSTAVVCIALVSSIFTIIAIRSYSRPSADTAMRSAASQTMFEKVLGKVGLMETPQQARDRRLKEQQAAIDYWNERVQTRRVQWDRITREAFDRNLQVIDQSVGEYTMILSQDPDDELSGEMLDSVLNDKMNMLREFSGL
jgi:hypothetical protein